MIEEVDDEVSKQHSELSSGILENDQTNAPTLAANPEMRRAFAGLIHEMDERGGYSMEDLANAIEERVFWKHGKRGAKGDNPYRYQALNLRRVVLPGYSKQAQTIEIRALRAQKDYSQFLKLIKLFESRIVHLKTLKGPLAFKNKPPPKTWRAKIENFKAYVQESGLDFKDYEEFLPRQAQRACEAALGSRNKK